MGETPPDRGRTGGLTARLVGGTAVMVMLGAAVIGLVLAARTTRLYTSFDARLETTMRDAVIVRLESAAAEITQAVTAAEAQDDWSALQAQLPARRTRDPELLELAVTDPDGLVLADSNAANNGRPLENERLLSHANEPHAQFELSQAGQPALAIARRIGHADDAHIVWVIGSAERLKEAALAREQEARQAIRFGWLLIGLGGLITLIVSVGAVLMVSGSLTKKLRAIAWRVGELGRGDRSTHLQVGGPAELRLVGEELALAARRIEAATTSLARETAELSDRAAQRRLVGAAIDPSGTFEHFSVATALATDATLTLRACALATLARAGGVVVILVEIASVAFTDALRAAQLRAAATALFQADPQLAPAQALRRLDPLIASLATAARARALIVVCEASGRARIASAGARLPILVAKGAPPRPLVVRGDRLGEVDPIRGTDVEVTLQPGDTLILTGEAPLDGHAAHDLHEALAALSSDLSPDLAAEARAAAIVAACDEPRPSVAVVLARLS